MDDYLWTYVDGCKEVEKENKGNKVMKGARNQYFQTLRGILIIFVISIHCVTGFGYDVASWNYDMYIIVRNLIGIAVPVFLRFRKVFRYRLFSLRGFYTGG